MHVVIIGLQFSALIPILVYFIFRPRLSLFFKLLLASILLSIVFDIIGTFTGIVYRNNLPALCIFNILNAIIITFLWQNVPFYSIKVRSLARNIGYTFIAIMVVTNLYFKCTEEGFYIISCLNVLLGLVLSLQYYYQKIKLSTYTPLTRDPYFITATACILFCLSTIIIIAAQLHFSDQPFVLHTWAFRQFFYLMYNIMIAYAFYVLFKIQQLPK